MAALRALDAQGLAPATIALRDPSLDDVFLALTGHHAEPEPSRRNPQPPPPEVPHDRSGPHRPQRTPG